MRTRAFQRLARLVGNTPLVEISQSVTRSRVLAKLEFYNPSGSVKDRAAKGMLEAALAAGRLAGRTILEATSGNTGIALAMFGSALGLPVELVMPANVTPERKRIIANYGARSIFTSNLGGYRRRPSAGPRSWRPPVPTAISIPTSTTTSTTGAPTTAPPVRRSGARPTER